MIPKKSTSPTPLNSPETKPKNFKLRHYSQILTDQLDLSAYDSHKNKDEEIHQKSDK